MSGNRLPRGNVGCARAVTRSTQISSNLHTTLEVSCIAEQPVKIRSQAKVAGYRFCTDVINYQQYFQDQSIHIDITFNSKFYSLSIVAASEPNHNAIKYVS